MWLCVYLVYIIIQQALNHKSSYGKIHYRIKPEVGRGCLAGRHRQCVAVLVCLGWAPPSPLGAACSRETV